jgi:NAD(P)-dependent dehydrogenase (short-subunit alcohol dehydrogenase family)
MSTASNSLSGSVREEANVKQVAVITGANTGIGYETAMGLLETGEYHVVICARSQEKADGAVASLLEQSKEQASDASAESLVLDLTSLSSIRAAASAFLASQRSLDVLILNAGIMALPWSVTPDGFEQQWQVNFLGHFLFCRLLLPAMDRSRGRIIHVSSGAHRLYSKSMLDYEALASEHKSSDSFEQWLAYGRSKLANILFSNELARRLHEQKEPVSRITSNALHPGNVKTNLWTNIGRTNDSGISIQKGAATPLFLASSDKAQGHSGGYYYQCEPITKIYNEEDAKSADYIAKLV